MNAIDIFQQCGAILKDTHVVYASGRHGNAYLNKDAIYPHIKHISELCRMIAEIADKEEIDIVAGPTVGGVIIAQWVAHFLSQMKKKDILAVFAEEVTDEKGEKTRIFKRGYDKLIKGKNLLVVEDILTTGGSVKKVVDAAVAIGANIKLCVALINRGGVKDSDVGAKLVALSNFTLDSWEEGECPLCKSNVPINVNVGKGREYLQKRGK